jgi:hypothetical protein
MTYSRKRIILVGCLWLIAGIAGASVYGVPQVTQIPEADGAAGPEYNCGAPPCQFPAESHVGGIVLGTTYLFGQEATTFGDPSFLADQDGGDPEDPGMPTPLPPDRVDPTDATVGLGVNDLEASKFFLYKSWKYDDPQAQNADVYMWINTSSAGIRTEGGDTGCGDGSPGFGGSARCDLLINSGEISTGYLSATLTGSLAGFVNPLDSSEYWIDDPELSTCGIVDVFSVGLCLELLRDGLVSSFPGINSVTVYLNNFQVRTHYARALPSGGYNKILELNNGYLEIRHGKGADRSRVYPVGNTTYSTSRAQQWADPIEAYGGDDPTERNGVSQGFRCTGGANGDQDCDPSDDPPSPSNTFTGSGDDGDRVGGDENDGSYDDIHDAAGDGVTTP